jgi:hypothetical protein
VADAGRENGMFAEVKAGAWSTVSVKGWVAAGETPLAAVTVMW